jgi:hypothetical protein
MIVPLLRFALTVTFETGRRPSYVETGTALVLDDGSEEWLMFRQVQLAPSVPGRLLLHSMPGRREALDVVWDQIKRDHVSVIVCLAGRDEIREKSPEYGRALDTGAVPCPVQFS